MKNLTLIFFLVFAANASNAQFCFWAQNGSGSNSDLANDISTDYLGNVYVTGSFTSPSLSVGSFTLNSTSVVNFFLVKYDAAGNVQWAQTANGIAEGYSITNDTSGNVLVSGYFDGISTTFDGITLTNAGGGDAFVLKYNPDGNIIWAKSIGGSGNTEYAYSITTDQSNAIYITGRFSSSTMTIGSTVLTNQGLSGPDIFITKFDSLGNVLWADGVGGNFNDIAYGIACDDQANIYVTGNFNSDNISFGANNLTGQGTGATSIFVAKYDSTGVALWANKWESTFGDVYAYDVSTDGICAYITGEYSGSSITFGSDNLTNLSAGSSDAFTAKLNPNGNELWAKSFGGNNYDYAKGITTDEYGNIYSIGYFSSTTFNINSDTLLNNPSPSYYNNTYITKYDSSGVYQWALLAGSVHTSGKAVACGPNEDVYFAGKFLTTTTFGTVDLSSGGSEDFFVADVFQFNSGISTVTDASCFGASDGSAESFVSGGHLPYTYLWNTMPAQTTSNASGLPAGNYSLTVTEAYGCEQTSNVSISEPNADSALICMVTVDELSQHNIIIWDKTSFTTVDSFIIYREISTANFQPIAIIPFDSLSQFVDTVSTLYFPNTGNPNVGTYRYKIQAKSSCGTTGPMSPYHNTIYISNTGGTFTWPQLYEIEGEPNPVISYVLMRDDLSDGNWNAVGSVAGTQSFIIDPDYNTYQATASWRVQTVWSIDCTPTKSINTSYSNKFSNSEIGIIETESADKLQVYPNPFSGATTIIVNLENNSNVKLEIYNELGQIVETIVNSEHQSGNYQYTLNAAKNGYKPGVYYVRLTSGDKLILKKIVLI